MRAWPANVVFYGSAHSKPCFQYLRWVIKDTRSPAVSSANATRGESFSPKDLSLEVAIFFLIRSLVCSFLVQPTYSQLSKFKTIVLGRAKHLRVPALLQMSAVCVFFSDGCLMKLNPHASQGGMYRGILRDTGNRLNVHHIQAVR